MESDDNSGLRELCDAARQVVSGLGVAAPEDAAWAQISELGWLMVATPEARGGLGMGMRAACALQQELGRGLATVPYLPAMLAIEALNLGEVREGDDRLEQLMAGELLVTAALSRGNYRLDRDGSVSGAGVALPSADRAGYALVVSADHACVALVDLRAGGARLSERPTWDATRRLFDLALDRVPVPESDVIARGDEAHRIACRLALWRDFGLAADAVGGAAALLEITVDYLQTRRQFGRPLAMFQALKHRCADLRAMIEGADALLWHGLSFAAGPLETDSDVQAADALGRRARQLACETFAAVAEEALQLHGGIGMTSEHECHLFLKRAMLSEHLGREPDDYDLGVADALLKADA